jgi:hypothetical protein
MTWRGKNCVQQLGDVFIVDFEHALDKTERLTLFGCPWRCSWSTLAALELWGCNVITILVS